MKIIYVHCGEEMNVGDPRSCKHYWTSSWNKTKRCYWLENLLLTFIKIIRRARLHFPSAINFNLNLNGNIIILLAINREGRIYPSLKWHRIMVTTLVKSKDYLNSQNCKTFPTRSQFPYECLNCPYCVSFIFKLVCFSRFQPGMVNPNIPVILINSIVIQEYANKNTGYWISIII